MFRSLPRSGTYRSKTYCMEKAFEFLKANKAVAFKNLHSIIRMLLDERTEYALSLQKNTTQSHKLQNDQGKTMIAKDSFVPLL